MTIDKILNHPFRFNRDIPSSIINSDRRSRPHEDVLNAGFKSIRPIIRQNGVVSVILERNMRVMCERVC